MKKVTVLILALLVSGGIMFAQGTAENEVELVDGAKISFTNTLHDFGANPQGTPVSHSFIFKNIGNEPLVLQNVKASCGCTTPYWPKEPILPGQESKIDVKYNMARAGNFTKSITVTVKPKLEEETPEIVRLTIKGSAAANTPENSVDEVAPSIITNPNIPE